MIPDKIKDMIKAIKTWCLGKFQPIGDYATKSSLNNYVTEKKMTEYAQPIGNYADKSALQDYSLVSAAGNNISLIIDPVTYIMTLALKNANGEILSEKTIDFPIESMVIGASYDSGVITFTLQNGTEFDADISAIVNGLVNDAFTIAGINMKDDITEQELRAALSINNVENKSGATIRGEMTKQEVVNALGYTPQEYCQCEFIRDSRSSRYHGRENESKLHKNSCFR